LLPGEIAADEWDSLYRSAVSVFYACRWSGETMLKDVNGPRVAPGAAKAVCLIADAEGDRPLLSVDRSIPQFFYRDE
jgi:hypothetical protein